MNVQLKQDILKINQGIFIIKSRQKNIRGIFIQRLFSPSLFFEDDKKSLIFLSEPIVIDILQGKVATKIGTFLAKSMTLVPTFTHGQQIGKLQIKYVLSCQFPKKQQLSSYFKSPNFSSNFVCTLTSQYLLLQYILEKYVLVPDTTFLYTRG